jgi:ubiquitin-activating enzyme E1
LVFESSNGLHVDYVLAAANLKAAMYGIPGTRERSLVMDMMKQVNVPEFTPLSDVKIAENDAEAEAINDNDVDDDRLEQLQSDLPPPTDLSGVTITPLEFEKDDDMNFHMDFIVAASNLRATNYDIATADRHKSKLIAGKIIPAIATTTSLVSGLACLELYKLAHGNKKLESYKNGFVNLALPFFAFSEPIPPEKKKYIDTEFSEWDRFDMEGDMTLRELMAYFKDTYSLEITMLSHGVTLLYTFFMAATKKEERMDKKMTELVQEALDRELDPSLKALVFQICCNDPDGEDVEVPPVRYSLPAPS